MSNFKKPMLAATAKTINDVVIPCYASRKLDGVRCLMVGGVALSRSLKPIPNKFIQAFAKSNAERLDGFDGELLVGPWNSPDVYNTTVSAVMRQEGSPEFNYAVFDRIVDDCPFYARVPPLMVMIKQDDPTVKIVYQTAIANREQLELFEQDAISQGYEGVITRDPVGLYKHGRSTLKQQGMIKLKRFEDSEAEIIGYEELMHNDNEAKTNELGNTSRSTEQAGLRPGGTLGALLVRDIHTGVSFKIGTGFSQQQRDKIWEEALGGDRDPRYFKLVKYKFFPVGVKEKPRHPVFLGFRSPEDM